MKIKNSNIKMTEVRQIEFLPQELLNSLKEYFELEEDESFDDSKEIYEYIDEAVGSSCEPKKKGDWYIGKTEPITINGFTIVGQYKQFIKNYDCICHKEFDCLLYSQQ